MNGTLELYCSKIDKTEKGKTTTEHLSMGLRKGGGSCFSSLEELAGTAGNVFFGNGNGGYVYDKVIMYSSNDKNIEGKPYIVITRDGAELTGDASPEFKRLCGLMNAYLDKERKRVKEKANAPKDGVKVSPV